MRIRSFLGKSSSIYGIFYPKSVSKWGKMRRSHFPPGKIYCEENRYDENPTVELKVNN